MEDVCCRVLKELGVTAVLNAAHGSMEDWDYVKTGPAYYQAVGMGRSGSRHGKVREKAWVGLVVGMGWSGSRHG